MTTSIIINKDAPKLALVATMIGFLDVMGHRWVKSRIPGCPTAPPVIAGTLSNERPDIFSDFGARPVLIETVTREDMKTLDPLEKRLYLFYTTAEARNWDFYLACYKAIAPMVKQFCTKHGVRYTKLWEI